MRVTIKRIAQELGISHSTVSRVLNEKQSNLVSEATRDRIMQAASKMGYRPNRIAQALQGKGTQLIGVLVPDSDDYFFQQVIKNLRHTLEESDYELMVFASARPNIASTWQRLLQWDLDGIFVFDYLFYVDGLWQALTQHTGVIPPIAGLFSNKTQLKDCVSLDFAPALRGLLDQLYRDGRRSFGYVALKDSFTPAEQRYAVFGEFTRDNGVMARDIPLAEGYGTLMEAAKVGLADWLKDGHSVPEAIFCQNDEIAFGVYRGLRERGLRIPEDVALAGCDDLPFDPYLDTSLTSLKLPVAEACRQGWSVLQKRMEDPESPPLRVVLEVSLISRASTANAAAAHADLTDPDGADIGLCGSAIVSHHTTGGTA